MDVVAQVMNIQQSMGMAHDEVLSVQHTARAMELFDVADTSQDGMISFYEMKGLCRKFKCRAIANCQPRARANPVCTRQRSSTAADAS